VLRIIAVFTLAAILFGLVHDQVTARVCVEYFTVAHRQIVDSTSPSVLGLVWGVVATWWAGALAGIVVSIAAREGPGPRLNWRDFVQPALGLALAMATAALLAGVAGYLLTASGLIHIVADYEDAIPPARQARFMADVWAHLASYAVGFLGALVIAARALLARRQRFPPDVGLGSRSG
jgi:hypothetical protein